MTTKEERRNLELAKQYLELVGKPVAKFEDLRAFLAEEITWQEMPNRFAPMGRTGDYATIQANWAKGREHLPEQTYILRQALADGDTVALEIDWRGQMKKALGPFSAGTRLSARVAIFIRFRDGKIISQTDYPCYHPIADSSGAGGMSDSGAAGGGG